MDLTYSDMYALIAGDPKAEQYFRTLPGHVQSQIMAKKQQPASFDALVRMAEEAHKIV